MGSVRGRGTQDWMVLIERGGVMAVDAAGKGINEERGVARKFTGPV